MDNIQPPDNHVPQEPDTTRPPAEQNPQSDGDTLVNLAQQIGDARMELYTASIALSDIEDQINQRKAELTPYDGWPGTNKENRQAAQEKAYADDVQLMSQMHELATAKRLVELHQMLLENLQDMRRGFEWRIAAKMTDVLGKRNNAMRGDLVSIFTAVNAMEQVQEVIDDLDNYEFIEPQLGETEETNYGPTTDNDIPF